MQKWRWPGVLGLAAVAFISVLLATRHGPGVSNDSVDYLVAARNLIAGRGFTDFEGQAVTTWPPGYPFALRSGDLVGLDLVLSARLVNAAALAAVVVLAFVLLRRHVRSRALVFAGLLLVTFNPALLRSADYVQSELLFCALVLGFVVVIEDIVRKPERRVALILAAAVISWAAFLTRYAGVWLPVVGVLALVVDTRRSKGWRAALTSALSFGVLASLVPLLWLVRNAATGSVLGVRVPSDLGPIELAGRVLSSVGYWFLPEPIPHVPGQVSRAAAIALGAVAVAAVAATALKVYREGAGARAAARLTPTLLVILVVTYLGFAVVSHLRTGSSMDSRIMTPIVVPVIVLMVWLTEHILSGSREPGRVLPTRFVVVAVVLTVATEALLFAGLVYLHGRAAREYATTAMTRSELIREVRGIDPTAVVFSNDPWAVAYGAGHEPVRLAPRSLRPGDSHRPAAVRDLAAAASCRRSAFLAWFFDSPEAGKAAGPRGSRDPPPRYRSKGSVTSVVRLRPFARAADGTLYRIENRQHDRSCELDRATSGQALDTAPSATQ